MIKFKIFLITSALLSLTIGIAAQLNPQAKPEAVENKSVVAKVSAKSSQVSRQKSTERTGLFTSGEAPTQGNVQLIVNQGKSYLQLESNFKTSRGPDLVVILHKSGNIIGSTQPPNYPLRDRDYIILAPLQKNSGAQTYKIPDRINLANYRSVAIWCRRFNATFGAAMLN